MEPREILLEDRVFFMDVLSQDDIYEGVPIIESDTRRPSLFEMEELVRRRSGLTDVRQMSALTARLMDRLNHPNRIISDLLKLTDEHESLYSGSSILSFFRDPTAQPYWAQYASLGSGYGLVFDFSCPWSFEQGRGDTPGIAVPFPVIYTARRPLITIDLGPVEPGAAWREIESALLTKSDQWAHQREARLLRVGIAKGYVSFPAASLRAVVLGNAISAEHRAMLLSLVEQRSQPLLVLQASRSRRNYALDLVPVT